LHFLPHAGHFDARSLPPFWPWVVLQQPEHALEILEALGGGGGYLG